MACCPINKSPRLLPLSSGDEIPSSNDEISIAAPTSVVQLCHTRITTPCAHGGTGQAILRLAAHSSHAQAKHIHPLLLFPRLQATQVASDKAAQLTAAEAAGDKQGEVPATTTARGLGHEGSRRPLTPAAGLSRSAHQQPAGLRRSARRPPACNAHASRWVQLTCCDQPPTQRPIRMLW
jgi:hypothetical protein